MERPWKGQTEPPQPTDRPQYDENCFMCPGNAHLGGEKNEKYSHTIVFENKFPAVLPMSVPSTPVTPHPLLRSEAVHGRCDVIVFHPRHDLTLADLSIEDIETVVEEWIRIYEQRGREPGIEYVQIFENKGTMMGCSNPHPHGQVWSLSTVPTIPYTELTSLKRYASSHTTMSSTPKGPKNRPCLLCDYVHFELGVPEHEGRVVVRNDDWVALVPWWAVWPFELLLLPYHRHVPSIIQLTSSEKSAFADILSKVTRRYDNLFSCSFPYSMGIHQRSIPPPFDKPEDDVEDDIAHLHLHFTPPLLRDASIRKFLVGFELMAEPQRDLTPEQAAERLRETSM